MGLEIKKPSEKIDLSFYDVINDLKNIEWEIACELEKIDGANRFDIVDITFKRGRGKLDCSYCKSPYRGYCKSPLGIVCDWGLLGNSRKHRKKVREIGMALNRGVYFKEVKQKINGWISTTSDWNPYIFCGLGYGENCLKIQDILEIRS